MEGADKPDHWDLMFEDDGALKTWSLFQLPTCWQNAEVVAMGKSQWQVEATQLDDHRIEYLRYEGPVSGNRGEVRCCDRGTYRTLERSQNAWVLEIDGTQLAGKVALTRDDAQSAVWQLACDPVPEP